MGFIPIAKGVNDMGFFSKMINAVDSLLEMEETLADMNITRLD